MHSMAASVISYVGNMTSSESLFLHQLSIGIGGPGARRSLSSFGTSGQSPRFMRNSVSGRRTRRERKPKMLSGNMLKPMWTP